ncbi:hypothetical protein LZ023_38800 (plasmid) [Pseudomonas silvicola]|nr:hypothetical protein LZ023_38800 [Pseudomonas silvicola]
MQSALSRASGNWKSVAGCAVIRSVKPIRLRSTPEGQTFLATASKRYFPCSHLRNDLHQRYSSRTAVLRFAMLNTLSLTFFPDWIQRLNLQPNLSYIRLCNQKPTFAEHISTLHSGETDFLLTYAHDAVSLIHQLAAYPRHCNWAVSDAIAVSPG